MKLFSRGFFWGFIALFALVGQARADDYSKTIELFKNAGESADFFKKSYAYAVFPTIGKAGLGIGGAGGSGRVYEKGNYVGDVSMSQISVGFQAGGQAYSQIVFLQDKRAFDEFTSGEFAFGAGIGAIAITASASGYTSAITATCVVAAASMPRSRGASPARSNAAATASAHICAFECETLPSGAIA